MTTWLHDLDALTSLAEGPPGLARDWANTRLALRAPSRVLHLPKVGWDASLAVAAGAPIDDPAVDPVAVDSLGWAGRIPEDPREWVEVLRPRALAGDEPDLIRLLADLGALDVELLGVLSRSQDPSAHRVTPGLVLRWAAANERPLDPLAVQVAESVARLEPSVLDVAEMGAVLGLPRLLVLADDPAEAVRVGSARAGAPFEPPPLSKGSARRRADRMVQAVLDGVPGPAAAWLRAIAPIDGIPVDWVCGLAGWCAAFRPDPDPIRAVTTQAGGEDRVRLSAARRAVTAARAEVVEAALFDPEMAAPPAGALAAELVGRDRNAPLALALSATLHASQLQLALIGVAALPDPPEWLTARAVGLMFARYLPTEEVLAALLAAEYDDPMLVVQNAWALAEMGDPAAFESLQALADHHREDEELAAAVAHGATLLGR